MSSSIEQYYQKTGGEYRMSSTRRVRVLELLDQAITHIDSMKIRILDIGIGNGEISRHCREKYPDREISIEAADISTELLSTHAALYAKTHAINVDDEGWTSSFDSPFDIIVASELIEHLFRPDVFLERARGVLADNGFLLLSTPNMLMWSHRIKFLLGRQGYSDKGVFEWGHIHLFSWPFLVKLLGAHKYAVVATMHLLYPNALHRFARFFSPSVFAFQFILLAQKKE